ncbi:uncharacterized protein K444DRAFT_576831 [Hyaloscypha bicolor E]|uniref:C2H2-type domain-containing protein n=1 Tax=Hyaloscypha bicolor E TaxID=1095630 RepID=A0A2J6SFZ3_9HELO|nr:uncharacterized protein K444DRAFT_576831 [Hyaloscypha bicolor E]PMD49670.1 hypothetical protein K444DRAFT_576831 [Hyaloscypha bicolor E]
MDIASQEHIRTNANICLETFSHLCKLHGEDSWFEDQKARCKLWAADLGVFAPMRVSADHRLREYPVIRQVINQLLRGVAANLVHLAKLSSSETLSTSSDQGQEEEQQENLSDSSGSSCTVPSLPSDTNYDNVDSDAISLCRLSVKDAITRLYTISTSIRHSGSRYRDQRAEAFVNEDSERRSQAESFLAVSKAILDFKYQKASEQLRERTAKTIILRQNRIFYRRSHREKRAEVVPHLPEESPIVIDSHSATSATKTNLHLLEHDLKSGTEYASQSTVGSSTGSSTFGSTDSHMQPLQFPRPPNVKPGDHFSCNYCCKLCPAEETGAKRWRKHIIRDLMPYFCVFEDCSTPAELFDNFNDWLLHMRQAHQRSSWVCFSPAHEPKTFNAEDLYAGHLESDHPGTFSGAELPTLTRMAMRSTFHLFTKCPFCLQPPKGSDSLGEGLITNEEEYRLQKHVADHLISSALISLRWVDDTDKTLLASSSSAAHSKRSTISGLGSEYSLPFEDPPGRGNSEEDTSSGLVGEEGWGSYAFDTQDVTKGQENDSSNPIPETQNSQNDIPTLHVDNIALNLAQATIDPSAGSYTQQNLGRQNLIRTRDPDTSREEFDPHYKVHDPWAFRWGKVFKVLWAEPKDENGEGSDSGGSVTVRKDARGEEIFAKVRRFVIIKAAEGHCICLPINTYSGQGVNKKGVHADHHAIIYSGRRPVAFRGEKEKGLTMRSIKVSPDNARHKLDDASRLNYAKTYTVEYNVKVWFIGKVSADSEWQIRTDFNRVHPPLAIKGVKPSDEPDIFNHNFPATYGSSDGYATYQKASHTTYGYSAANPYTSAATNTQVSPSGVYGSSAEFYDSGNIAQTGGNETAPGEWHREPSLGPMPEEGESHEEDHGDIYDA